MVGWRYWALMFCIYSILGGSCPLIVIIVETNVDFHK